jgi:hypothetical protein
MINKDYALCYVKDNFAYFTNQIKQSGPGWDEADFTFFSEEPYETLEESDKSNAAIMNTVPTIRCVAFKGARLYKHVLDYSVNHINRNRLPWLITERGNFIVAGTPFSTFILNPEIKTFIPLL